MAVIVIVLFASAAAVAAADARGEAISAVRGLRSVIDGGAVTFQEYIRRVNDAQVVVDEYLSRFPKEVPVRDRPLARSMMYYLAAAKVWQAEIRKEDLPMGAVGELAICGGDKTSAALFACAAKEVASIR